MTTEKEIIQEAIRKLIARHKEEYKQLLDRVRRQVDFHGGILK